MSAKRLGIEALLILVLAAVGAGIWWLKDRQMASRERACESRLAALADDASSWARAVAAGEAETAFRAFAAGVAPAVLAGRQDTLEQAKKSLLEIPGVSFIHILAADGSVLASSDEKLTVTGKVGPDAAWVLATNGLARRSGGRPGTVELAAPVVGPTGPVGFLWMGYETGRAVEKTRPPGLVVKP